MEKKAGTSDKAVVKALTDMEKVVQKRKFYVDTKEVNKIMNVTKVDNSNKKDITKYELLKRLGELKDLSPYIPPLEEVRSCSRFIHFIKKHKRVIIRPMAEVVRMPDCVIEKIEDGYEITGDGEIVPRKLFLSDDKELAEFFKDFFNKRSQLVIQKYIKLARVEQSVCDVRIVLKRVDSKAWKCFGIEWKVGENIFILRALGKDKYTIPLKEALRKTFPIGCNYEKVMRKINELCLKSCKSLKHMGDTFNRFDFDIAIDENRRLWIIGVNHYTNLEEYKVVDYSIYNPKRRTSILYAASSH